MTTMSRIPKFGFGASIGVKEKESKVEVNTKRSNQGLKRPSNDNLSLEKKPRLNFNSASTESKAISSVQPSTVQRNKFATVQKSKRVLQLIPDPDPIRCSMPAVSSTGNFKIPGKPKRAAWDLNGRVQDMEENFKATKMYNNSLVDQLQMCNQRIAALEATNSVINQDFEEKSIQSEEATFQIQKLESQLKEKTEEHEIQIQRVKSLEQEMASLKANYETLQNRYPEEINALKSQITSLTSMKFGVEAQLEAAELLAESLRGQIKQLDYICKEKDSKIEFQSLQISEMDSKIRHEETIRRKLHNTIQELEVNQCVTGTAQKRIK